MSGINILTFNSNFTSRVKYLHGILWKSIEFNGNPWNSMKIHGIPWNFHGVPWNPMEYPWSSMESHGVSMEFHEVLMKVNGIPWSIVAFVQGMQWGSRKYPWGSMECHNVSMGFDRIPCSLYEKIYRNSVIKQLINLLNTCSSLHFLLDRKIGNIWKLSKSKIVRLV